MGKITKYKSNNTDRLITINLLLILENIEPIILLSLKKIKGLSQLQVKPYLKLASFIRREKQGAQKRPCFPIYHKILTLTKRKDYSITRLRNSSLIAALLSASFCQLTLILFSTNCLVGTEPIGSLTSPRTECIQPLTTAS